MPCFMVISALATGRYLFWTSAVAWGSLRRGLPDERVDRFVGIDPASVAVLEARKQAWARSEFHIGAVPDPGLG